MIRKLIKLGLWSSIAAVAYFLYRTAFAYPELVENVYSRSIYPVLSQIAGFVANLVPFSLGEVLLYLFAISIVFFIVYIIKALFLPTGMKLYGLIKRILSLVVTLCTIYSVFVFGWGLNYARQPLATSMGLKTSRYTVSELEDACKKLAASTSKLRKLVDEDSNGVFRISSSKEEIMRSVTELYDTVAPEYMNLGAKVRAKPVGTVNMLSVTDTTGIFCPFTSEPNINMQMPESFFPSTVAHEYAHLKGFAREDEANFISWYICRQSSNNDFAYSGNLLALTHAMNALAKESPKEHAKLYYELDPGVVRDWDDNNAYWKKFESVVTKQTSKIYDTYLKSNGVSDGKKSYGRMVDLIIALDKAGKL